MDHNKKKLVLKNGKTVIPAKKRSFRYFDRGRDTSSDTQRTTWESKLIFAGAKTLQLEAEWYQSQPYT